MRRPLKVAAWALLGALSLVACGPPPVTVTVDVTFEGATPAEVAAATGTLAARFKAWSASGSSRQEVSSNGASIHIDFRGEAPSEADIRYFAGTQGIYRTFPADQASNLLMTDRDVESVDARVGSAGPELVFVVSDAAAARLEDFTRRNRGRVLLTTFERKVLVRAAISGTFGKRFQLAGIDADTAHRMTVILRSGRLPVVRDVRIARAT